MSWMRAYAQWRTSCFAPWLSLLLDGCCQFTRGMGCIYARTHVCNVHTYGYVVHPTMTCPLSFIPQLVGSCTLVSYWVFQIRQKCRQPFLYKPPAQSICSSMCTPKKNEMQVSQNLTSAITLIRRDFWNLMFIYLPTIGTVFFSFDIKDGELYYCL